MSIKTIILTKRNLSVSDSVRTIGQDNIITVIWSTGYKGLRHDDEIGSFYEELKMTEDAVDLSRLNAGAPFLIQHDDKVSSTIGVVRKAWLDSSGIGYAEIELSGREDVAGYVTDIKKQILKNISVGYSIQQYTETTQRNDKTPTYLATKWVPHELSLVAVGFDPHAQIFRNQNNEATYEASIIQTKDTRMEFMELSHEEKEAHIVAKLEKQEELNPEEQAFYDEYMKPKEEPKAEEAAQEERTQVDVAELQRQAVETYKKRQSTIKTMVSASKLSLDTEELANSSLSIEQISEQIFKQLEESNKPLQTKLNKGQKSMDKRQAAVEGLITRSLIPNYQTTSPLKNASLLDILESVIPRNAGETVSAYSQRAIKSSDLADILTSASQKIVDDSVGSFMANYKKFTKNMALRDFKLTPVVSLGGYGLSTPATEGDAYSESSLTDSKENIQLRVRGTVLTLSAVSIQNDDASVLEQLPAIAQQVAETDLDKAVFGVINANAAMSDTVALFHATHKNIVADATGVDVASMARAEQLLAEAEKNGMALNLKPKYIIVAPKYAYQARQIVGGLVSAESSKFNPYAGSGIEVIVSNELTDKESWYVVADPAQCPAIMTGTLNGATSPTVQAQEDFASSSQKLKVEFHNGAKATNYQAIVKLTIDDGN